MPYLKTKNLINAAAFNRINAESFVEFFILMERCNCLRAYLMSLFFSIATHTRGLPTIFKMTKTDCTVVMAIFGDSEIVYTYMALKVRPILSIKVSSHLVIKKRTRSPLAQTFLNK